MPRLASGVQIKDQEPGRFQHTNHQIMVFSDRQAADAQGSSRLFFVTGLKIAMGFFPAGAVRLHGPKVGGFA